MKKIRVIVANRPRLMQDLVLATIADQPDIEIIGAVTDEAEILAAVEKDPPHCLIVALDEGDERPSVCDRILEKHPEIRVLAIAPERNSTIYFWASLEIRSKRVETSEQGVLNALRCSLPPSERLIGFPSAAP